MRPRRFTRMLGVIVAGMIGLLTQGGPRAIAAGVENPNDDSGVEVLTRGPVHEAFAEPNSYAYVLVYIHLGSRKVYCSRPTRNPDSEWVMQQARNASM